MWEYTNTCRGPASVSASKPQLDKCAVAHTPYDPRARCTLTSPRSEEDTKP